MQTQSDEPPFPHEHGYLHPNAQVPMMLPSDFYLRLVGNHPSTKLTDVVRTHEPNIPNHSEDSFTGRVPPTSLHSGLTAVTQDILQANDEQIHQAALKLAASGATTPGTGVYHDLIPLSFDEEQLVRDEEQRREKARQHQSRIYTRRSQ